MRDLDKYAKKCMQDLDAIGIKYGHIVRFYSNSRARRWGQCRNLGGNWFEIQINSMLLDEKNDENGLINTIFHELLHTCKGCMNHGWEWQKLANKVHSAYGYNIKRTSSAEEKGLSEEAIQERARRVQYVLRCEGCGQIFKRERMCKLVEHPENYRCGNCRGKLVLLDDSVAQSIPAV